MNKIAPPETSIFTMGVDWFIAITTILILLYLIIASINSMRAAFRPANKPEITHTLFKPRACALFILMMAGLWYTIDNAPSTTPAPVEQNTINNTGGVQ